MSTRELSPNGFDVENPLSAHTPEEKAASLRQIHMERQWIERSFRLGLLEHAAWAFLSVWSAADRTGLNADDLAEIMGPYVERLARLVDSGGD